MRSRAPFASLSVRYTSFSSSADCVNEAEMVGVYISQITYRVLVKEEHLHALHLLDHALHVRRDRLPDVHRGVEMWRRAGRARKRIAVHYGI